jgi:hypothetical protein
MDLRWWLKRTRTLSEEFLGIVLGLLSQTRPHGRESVLANLYITLSLIALGGNQWRKHHLIALSIWCRQLSTVADPWTDRDENHTKHTAQQTNPWTSFPPLGQLRRLEHRKVELLSSFCHPLREYVPQIMAADAAVVAAINERTLDEALLRSADDHAAPSGPVLGFASQRHRRSRGIAEGPDLPHG